MSRLPWPPGWLPRLKIAREGPLEDPARLVRDPLPGQLEDSMPGFRGEQRCIGHGIVCSGELQQGMS